MIAITAYNPRATSTGIELNVDFEGVGIIPFHATPADSEQHGRDLYARALAGEFGAVVPYIAPEVEEITIGQLAEIKLAAIQAEKIRVRDGGVLVEGILFDTDESAMSAYTKTMVFLFSQSHDASIQKWKASEGVWVTMTLSLMTSIVPVAAANETSAFAWQAAREIEVAEALAANDMFAVQNVSEIYQPQA